MMTVSSSAQPPEHHPFKSGTSATILKSPSSPGPKFVNFSINSASRISPRPDHDSLEPHQTSFKTSTNNTPKYGKTLKNIDAKGQAKKTKNLAVNATSLSKSGTKKKKGGTLKGLNQNTKATSVSNEILSHGLNNDSILVESSSPINLKSQADGNKKFDEDCEIKNSRDQISSTNNTQFKIPIDNSTPPAMALLSNIELEHVDPFTANISPENNDINDELNVPSKCVNISNNSSTDISIFRDNSSDLPQKIIPSLASNNLESSHWTLKNNQTYVAPPIHQPYISSDLPNIVIDSHNFLTEIQPADCFTSTHNNIFNIFSNGDIVATPCTSVKRVTHAKDYENESSLNCNRELGHCLTLDENTKKEVTDINRSKSPGQASVRSETSFNSNQHEPGGGRGVSYYFPEFDTSAATNADDPSEESEETIGKTSFEQTNEIGHGIYSDNFSDVLITGKETPRDDKKCLPTNESGVIGKHNSGGPPIRRVLPSIPTIPSSYSGVSLPQFPQYFTTNAPPTSHHHYDLEEAAASFNILAPGFLYHSSPSAPNNLSNSNTFLIPPCDSTIAQPYNTTTSTHLRNSSQSSGATTQEPPPHPPPYLTMSPLNFYEMYYRAAALAASNLYGSTTPNALIDKGQREPYPQLLPPAHTNADTLLPVCTLNQLLNNNNNSPYQLNNMGLSGPTDTFPHFLYPMKYNPLMQSTNQPSHLFSHPSQANQFNGFVPSFFYGSNNPFMHTPNINLEEMIRSNAYANNPTLPSECSPSDVEYCGINNRQYEGQGLRNTCVDQGSKTNLMHLGSNGPEDSCKMSRSSLVNSNNIRDKTSPYAQLNTNSSSSEMLITTASKSLNIDDVVINTLKMSLNGCSEAKISSTSADFVQTQPHAEHICELGTPSSNDLGTYGEVEKRIEGYMAELFPKYKPKQFNQDSKKMYTHSVPPERSPIHHTSKSHASEKMKELSVVTKPNLVSTITTTLTGPSKLGHTSNTLNTVSKNIASKKKNTLLTSPILQKLSFASSPSSIKTYNTTRNYDCPDGSSEDNEHSAPLLPNTSWNANENRQNMYHDHNSRENIAAGLSIPILNKKGVNARDSHSSNINTDESSSSPEDYEDLHYTIDHPNPKLSTLPSNDDYKNDRGKGIHNGIDELTNNPTIMNGYGSQVTNGPLSKDSNQTHANNIGVHCIENYDKKNGFRQPPKVKEANPYSVLIEGVLFRASYLGSTHIHLSQWSNKRHSRTLQAREAVTQVKMSDGEIQPSTEVDLFISTEKIMVLNTNLQEIMMDHSLNSISYIADIGEVVVIMVKRNLETLPFLASNNIKNNDAASSAFNNKASPQSSYNTDIDHNKTTTNVPENKDMQIEDKTMTETCPKDENPKELKAALKADDKMICHVFESDEAHLIAQSIGQAFQIAYVEFLKAKGLIGNVAGTAQNGGAGNNHPNSPFFQLTGHNLDYQDVLNSQEIFGEELDLFSKHEAQKEVVIPKRKNEPLGIVIVESGWGSIIPTVMVANLNPGSPATRGKKLNIGDRIIAINGVSLVGLPLEDCQTKIKAVHKENIVKLKVISCSPVVEVRIKRPDSKFQLGFSVQNGTICSLLRGGIAERGGIRVGHRIIEINGESMVAIPHDKIVKILSTTIGEIHMKTMPTSIFRLLTGQETPNYL